MTEWGFYGRKEELGRVDSFLRRPDFGAMAIRGRRGIGKSELLAEGSRRVGGDPPFLMFELRPSSQESVGAARERLVKVVRRELGAGILDGLPPPDPMLDPDSFCDVVNHLLFRNVVVCLDEFHHGTSMGLEGPVKELVDRAESIQGPHPPGKLVVMGSHQQRFDAMFAADQALFGRLHKFILLKEWRVPTVLGMADGQGFLRNPGRFLTLWTAFGGIPRNWKAFASSDDDAERLRDFAAWPDDRSWRIAFLDWQRRRLMGNPRERFDNRSFIELAPPHREVLLWLALNAPRGATLPEFPAGLRHPDRNPPLRESLEVLRKHLELIKQTGEFHGDDEGRWAISDNNTLFQLSVYPEMFKPGGRTDESVPDIPRSLPTDRLETLEGLALERLAAAWLGGLPGVTYAGQGVRRNRRNPPVAHPEGAPLPPLADIDVLAAQGYLSDPDAVLFIGCCKRNPRRHDPAAVDRQADELLANLGPGGNAKRLRGMRRQRFLVSPEFKSEHRQRFGVSGHVCVDIPGMRLMAKELERSPDMDPMQLMLLADRRQLHMANRQAPGVGEPGPEGGPDRDGPSGPGM